MISYRMSFVKRHATTKTPKFNSTDFNQSKARFLFDAKSFIEFEDIPDSLILNWDQSAVHYVPISSWTMDREGSKRVEIKGIDDKRHKQIMAMTVIL